MDLLPTQSKWRNSVYATPIRAIQQQSNVPTLKNDSNQLDWPNEIVQKKVILVPFHLFYPFYDMQ